MHRDAAFLPSADEVRASAPPPLSLDEQIASLGGAVDRACAELDAVRADRDATFAQLCALLAGLSRDDEPRRQAIETARVYVESRCAHREILTVGPHGRCADCRKLGPFPPAPAPLHGVVPFDAPLPEEP